MGAGSCKICCEDGSDNNQMVTVETMHSVAESIKLGQEPVNTVVAGFMGGKLQGRWRRMEDKSLLGRIYEDKMIWQPLYQHPPTVLIATGEDRICMELEGAKHGGIVAYSASSARMLINWSDGEVWIKDP
eukprot:symbB.v1.2.032594.t1/scaffold3933.1/size58575/4